MAKNPIKSVNLLPEFLRTDKNSKFLSSTIDQLIQPPQLERLDGFIGSKLTPTYVSTSDVYVTETLELRRDYQLEPALIIKDELENVKEVKAIDDVAYEIAVNGGINDNFDRLFRPNIYSFDPHIDFDKFVNFQKYYWLVSGPDTIKVYGKQLNSTSTYTVIDNQSKTSWIFSPDGLTQNPTLVLYRGNTYKFLVDSQNKFFIKDALSLGQNNLYNINVDNNGISKGTVTIEITENTPSTLFYTNDLQSNLQGKIIIKQATEDSYIDVEKEILGKQNYTFRTGLELSNGMKIRFEGEVYPETYKDKEFFVEGVGNSITLIDFNNLTSFENLSSQFDDDFDINGFDEFAFDNFQKLPLDPEYITINKASTDLNPWSRYNRWVHEDIIRISAEYNNNVPVFPLDKRAKRPIIEFKANLKLYNFGSIGIQNVDLIDIDTLDAFSVVEGSAGYYVDGVALQQGHRVIFNADKDNLVRGRIYVVNFVDIDTRPKIALIPAPDNIPIEDNCLGINLGNVYGGKSFYFNGDKWIFSQQHDTLNQAPLFDLFDSDGLSYSGSAYKSDFKGTKIFGYEIGTGRNDIVLGFPLSYQNSTNVSSYKFKNYFGNEFITIFQDNVTTSIPTSGAFLKYYDEERYVNVYGTEQEYKLPILQLIVPIENTNTLELTAIEDPDTADYVLEIYIDNNKLAAVDWFLIKQPKKCFVYFENIVQANSNVLFKIFTAANKTSDGQYETPINLTNNPFNEQIDTLTLTEIGDHYKTMTERHPAFRGSVFGNNNTRDLSTLGNYGAKLISNKNSLAFSNLFLATKQHNIITALQKASDQYNEFKSILNKKIIELGNINDPIAALDLILTNINSDKDINSPWYSSIMLPYGNDKTTRTWTVTDVRNRIYPISRDYDPDFLQVRSVLVYLNNNQLILGKDYKFLPNDSSVELLIDINVNDKLRIDDFENLKGSYVPTTPSHLGIYPKFEPKKYIDYSYVESTEVIQGHDGSIIKAYNDFRDDIILEFEKRVYNSIKTTYDPKLFDINEILPGAFRQNLYSQSETNDILYSEFIRWSSFYNLDFTTNTTFDLNNAFTYNYFEGYIDPIDVKVSGNWRFIFKYLYDTDRPNTHPWEMLGFSIKPDWWESEYGPAPYTSGNLLLWEDLELGVIKQGPRAGIDQLYARPDLSSIIPVDQYGNLIQPNSIITDTSLSNIRKNWVFGDWGPAESSWRKSSFYPFAIQKLLALTNPATYCCLMYDINSIAKNAIGQIVNADSFEFVNLKQIKVSNYQDTLTSGFSVIVSEIGTQNNAQYVNLLRNELDNLNFNLFHKVGGFVSKDKLQIIIDSIDPDSPSSGALLPQENYKLTVNTSNPVRSISISGIIVQKTNGKFTVKGYDKFRSYFSVYRPRRNANTPTITVGGISESFVKWQPSEDSGQTNLTSNELTTANNSAFGNFYRQGQIVLYRDRYYRSKVSHRADNTFDTNKFQILPSLPIKGGATVQITNGYFNQILQVPYGTEYNTIQEVYDFIIGYGKWLEAQGFIFDEFNNDLNEVLDFNLSAKEFLYWSTQNWADNSVITLSPFANRIKFSSTNSIVNNIFDSYYGFNILKADGLPFSQSNLNVFRDETVCTISTIETTEGIYFAYLHCVQKEHAMIFDNRTIFNDVIYDPKTGYRQRRMKIVGFRTSKWNGDYFSPGFVYDKAKITEWSRYTTYLYGDIVRYSGNYYAAKRNITAAKTFDSNAWVLLNATPSEDLIPNFDYKINQFEDFYSLDIDNFDISQQRLAQGLIGYTPRVYLYNIFTNPISQYKFYQGFIKEKGTKNAVKKMAKASIFNLNGELDYTEEWAFRLGNYGSYSSFEEFEIGLNEGTFIENPQIVTFIDEIPTIPNDIIVYSTASNMLIKPEDYVSSETFVTTSTNNFVLPTAGYVSFDDITATAYNENSLIDIANGQNITEGSIFWLGFKSNGDWDVLRYTSQSAKIVGVYVSSPGVDITFVTDVFHNLSVNDIVNVQQFNNQVNGIYKIKSISKLNQFTVDSELVTILNEELLSPGILYKFESVRTNNFDNLPVDSIMLKYPYETKFWVDNETVNFTYDWKVYKKINNYENYKITSGYTGLNEKFGISMMKKTSDNLVMVGSTGFSNSIDNGRVFVYLTNGKTFNRLLSFTLNDSTDLYHTSSENTDFGFAVDFSTTKLPLQNYGIMFAGSPSASNIRTTGTILKYASTSTSIVASTSSGAVKVISVNQSYGTADTEIILIPPNIVDYGRFGASLNYNDKTRLLTVGAPGISSTGTGSVYIYQAVLPEAKTTIVTTASSGTNTINLLSTASIKVGYTVIIPNYINDISLDYKVQNIYDDGLVKQIILDKNLTSNIQNNSTIRFYTTANIVTTYGLYTSTNGVLFSFVNTLTAATAGVGNEYGYCIASSVDGKFTAISAPGDNLIETFVDIGSNSFVRQVHTSTIGIGRFGESLTMTSDGTYLFVGAPDIKNEDDSFGRVAIYKRIGNTFTYFSQLMNPVVGAGMKFGQEIAVSNSTTLAISAVGLNKTVKVAFDNESTAFDNSSTTFYDIIQNVGSVYIYNKLANANRFVLVDELAPTQTAGNSFGYSLSIDDNTVYVGAPAVTSLTTASFYSFDKIDKTRNSLDLYKQNMSLVDIETIQKVRLIDSFNESISDYLEIIDPVKGKIAGIADQELKYKSAYDPAIYSIGVAGVVVDVDTSWLDEHVGELWWDLSTVKYVWYEQGDVVYRKNNWGTLFPGATIDVYEWVRSTYLPSEWSALADTSQGLTEGISGQPKFVDNSCISVKQIYNSISNSFSNVYYYWVKNKVTVPNVKNRNINAYQISSIIADPTSYGIKFIAPINSNNIILSNVGPGLVGNRINLNVGYDKLKSKIPKHTEWSLIEEGSATSSVPELYEKKLFDSLLGKDNLGNIVPDPKLSERNRYGIGIRPRQTLFKNRKEALRELVYFTNRVLLENQLTGSYSFVNLNQQELPPDEFSREYDEVVEDNEALNIIDTRLFKQAKLSCTVDNGKIRSVTIVEPGFGYKVAPTVTIEDNGSAPVIVTEIDSLGRIIGATASTPGKLYTVAPKLTVRSYTVLVLADNFYNGKWTKFEWNQLNKEWERLRTQKFNTPLYWNYVDWKSSEYNSFIDYSFIIDQVYQLDTIEDIETGQYVKIKNIGDGRYAIVAKTSPGNIGTFGKGYDLVYSQNGTIQLSDSIWDSSNGNLGFDQNNTYDQTLYDQTPDLELFYILQALKQDLFINELKVYWNLFFFAAIKYALTEQKLLDYAFKTSFINVTNYSGLLDQRPVYKLRSSENYEEYLKEVKPYHSQIRTFTANHQIFESSNSYFTDFDLPAYYNKNTDKFEVAQINDEILDQEPYKSWKSNYTYTVGQIVVGDGGAGYIYPPQVTLETIPGDTGSGATAKSYVTNGKVSKIEIINSGKDYKQAPIVRFTGGGGDNFVEAKAYAQLENAKVRTNKIGIKFDRYSKNLEIDDSQTVDVFVGNGSKNQFTLNWYAEEDKKYFTVKFDGELVLSSNYEIIQYKEAFSNYNKKFTAIKFLDTLPGEGQIIEITYNKNIELFNAIDRINYYYQPGAGLPGKNFAHLLQGLEYSGVQLQGLKFDYTSKWDAEYSPFGIGAYADDIGYYKQLPIVQNAAAGTDTVTVSTLSGIVVGQLVNILPANKTLSTATVFFTQKINSKADVKVVSVTTATNRVKLSSTLTSALSAVTSTVYINNILTTVTNTATIEFWSYDNNAYVLDTVISGGSWNTATNMLNGALGIAPEDIIISGESFLSPVSSPAPEELIPGEIHDAIGLNVYTKLYEGTPVLSNLVIDVYANTITTASISFIPPNLDSIFVTYRSRNFSYTTNTNYIYTSTVNLPYFTYDWVENNIIIPPQTNSGKMGVTIIGIGGGRSSIQPGVLDRQITTIYDGSSQAIVSSFHSTSTVKSAYVSVNGISIPKVNSISTTTLGFVLEEYSNDIEKPSVRIVNLNTTTINTIQAWFFGTNDKYHNEFKQKVFNVTSSTNSFVIDQIPGQSLPEAGNIIVEYDANNGNGFVRLQGPFISYYDVDASVLSYQADKNIPRQFGVLTLNDVRVYLNGQQLIFGQDYTFAYGDSIVTIRENILQDNDLLIIVALPSALSNLADYDVVGNLVTLRNSIATGTVKITTFSNHDDLDIRSETFLGNLNRRFKVVRPIIDVNYVWVTVNGILLINNYDYQVLPDRRTVELADQYALDNNDYVVITTISNNPNYNSVIGYRIFNDTYNRSHYKRIAKQFTTELSQELNSTDTEIHVKDPSVLTPPLTAKNIPGVVFINNERIEFNVLDGNVLKQLRRGTLGTSVNQYIPKKFKVVDQSPEQNIPYSDIYQKQTILTTSSTDTYVISSIGHISTISLSGDTILNDGIILSTTATVNPINQIEVYYGGRKLRKTGIFVHDIFKNYDSADYDLIGSTATVDLLPITDVMNSAYLITATNEVWIYTNSLELGSINGYVYTGLKYLEPEFSLTVSINTVTAAVYASTASSFISTTTQDLSYDINGDGVITSVDVDMYNKLANNQYAQGINANSNYVNLLNQNIKLNITEGIKDNIKLTIMKKAFAKSNIWNSQINESATKPLFESNTVQAKFLQDKVTELPFENYYTEFNLLTLDSGIAVLNDDNEPLEGL